MQTTPNEICARFSALYTASVADILDRKGFRNQILPHHIQALEEPTSAICALAFTGEGKAHNNDSEIHDEQLRIEMLEHIFPNSFSVWKTNGDVTAAHWGEIMGTAAAQRGCKGVILDGGTRDVSYLKKIGFPVFCAFKNPASSIGRWAIINYMQPIVIGQTLINAYDYVMADCDGVVIIPQNIALEVLLEAEQVCAKEELMRNALIEGKSIREVYSEYGEF